MASASQSVERGRQFEVVTKWVLENHPLYAGRLARVWHWMDWPDRWGGDAGIDLVAQELDGRLWAVQVKAVDRGHWIKKSEIDSFLAEAARPSFGARLLVATTDNLGPRATAALDGVGAARLMMSTLESLDLDWPSDIRELTRRPRQRRQPRPASVEAVTAVVAGLRCHERGQLHMACGTGKTLVGLWVHEALDSASTLVLLPSLSLLSQTLLEWTENAHGDLRTLAVCSDESVAQDAFVQSTSELPIPVTTDEEAVATFLRGAPGAVVFATYQSLAVIEQACATAGSRFSLMIADEAHRCAGPQAGAFALGLDAARVPADRRLFMTATPKIYSDRVRRASVDAGAPVASMDDEELFGPVLHRLSFGRAIEQGLLSNYRVLIVGIDDPSLAEVVAERRLLQPDGTDDVVDAATLASLVATAKSMHRYELHRLVTFHNRVDAARAFSERLPSVCQWVAPEAVPVAAEHVSGLMPAGKRAGRLQHLREADADAPFVLSNARCLSEGVDVPNLDGVVFVEPRGSQIDIVQAVGRAIRSAPDKSVGTIVLPILLLDDGTEPDPEATGFATVWRVLRALQSHDETLAIELDAMRRALGRFRRRGGTTPQLPDRIVLDLPQDISADAFEALTMRLIAGRSTEWEMFFALLEDYTERAGTATPSWADEEDGQPLGQWAALQRSTRKQGGMSQARQARLESLNGWTWDMLGDKWERAYALLLRYGAENDGNLDVPQRATQDGFAVGAWVNDQRRKYRRHALSPEAIEQLDATPGWLWRPADSAEAHVKALQAFQRRHGHLRVDADHVEEGLRVGAWLDARRVDYRRRRSRLRTQALLDRELPGWNNGITQIIPKLRPPNEAWLACFELLKAQVAATGSPLLMQNAVVEGVALGRWVHMQRQAYRRGLLHEEAIRLLASLDRWSWSPQDDAWWRGLDRLREFAEQTGRVQPRQGRDNDEAPEIRKWVHKQRKEYAAQKLPTWRIEALETLIPGWSWTNPRTPRREYLTGPRGSAPLTSGQGAADDVGSGNAGPAQPEA